MSRVSSLTGKGYCFSLLFSLLKLLKVCFASCSLGVLGVCTFSSVEIPVYYILPSFLVVWIFYFPDLLLAGPLPQILFLILLTMMAPFFSSFSYFFLPVNIVEVLLTDLVKCVFSLRAFRLLLELLVFITFFFELLDVSSRLFLIELVIEVEPMEISALFLVEDEPDFFSFTLY